MELDMSQEKSNNAILSFVIDAKTEKHINEIKMSGEYSNILYEVPINKKWRAAVAIQNKEADHISLLPFYS